MRTLLVITGVTAFLIGASRLAHAETCEQPTIPLAAAIVSTRHITPGQSDGGHVMMTTTTTTASATSESFAWDARYIVDVDAAFEFKGGAIPFAVALQPETTLVETPGITAVKDWGGHITAICVAPSAIRDRTISASFLQASSRESWNAEAVTAFSVPIAQGNAVQIIDTTINADLRIDPSSSSSAILEHHVGYIAPRSIGHDAREEARRLTDTKLRVTANPIYLRGDDLRAMNGLEGRVTHSRAGSKGTAIGVGVLFAGMVAALIVAARRLKNAATEEHADAVLASRIDDLGAS